MDDPDICIMSANTLEGAMRMMPSLTWSVPISKEKADKLYQRLNARFASWTGKDLRNYKPE